METGLVWLEVIESSNYTINCKNVSDFNDDDSAEGNKYIGDESSGDVEDDGNGNSDGDNAFIIVLSLMAGIVTVILTYVWAVTLCRAHLRDGMIQRWLPFKPRTTSEHADDGNSSVDMSPTSPTTPSNRTKPSETTCITELDRVDYWEIDSVSRNSTHSKEVRVMLLPGTSRRSSSSQCGDDKNPYSELEGNETSIPDSCGTQGKQQTPGRTNPSPIDGQGSGSSTPGTSGHSPTFKRKGSDVEDGAECGTTEAPVESDNSLASKSEEQPSNSPNKLYATLESVSPNKVYTTLESVSPNKLYTTLESVSPNKVYTTLYSVSPNKVYTTLDSVGEATSHLRPIGQQ
ncbi:unnamed protein product, partial [Lymnaea stagnalis]